MADTSRMTLIFMYVVEMKILIHVNLVLILYIVSKI